VEATRSSKMRLAQRYAIGCEFSEGGIIAVTYEYVYFWQHLHISLRRAGDLQGIDVLRFQLRGHSSTIAGIDRDLHSATEICVLLQVWSLCTIVEQADRRVVVVPSSVVVVSEVGRSAIRKISEVVAIPTQHPNDFVGCPINVAHSAGISRGYQTVTRSIFLDAIDVEAVPRSTSASALVPSFVIRFGDIEVV
jgi:hypothetical protein